MSELVLDSTFFGQVLQDMGALIEKERDYLTGLDSDIGDGDHGINLSIGFREVNKQLDELLAVSPDIATLLKKSGMILLGKVGGASGPLYGSFFMKCGADVAGKTELNFDELCGMIINGAVAVQHRGKAELGDKTMMDAFLPGIEVLENRDADADPVVTFTAFVEAMHAGAQSTIPLIAKKGRALRLGERAIGHIDPGSESSWMLMNVILENLKKAV
ncbi:dihydroxyacetone kinase subunit L [Listeria seeligeri]|uniref:phosphoenolpyruvate--glycerone phosphotransferase n=1 Tax=Listeria seeligeri TaxID=1640 RepID=A0A7X1C747_LISSE|nr:dihydroxyacetone kinase subunit DhaL [Listeria seeligeri]MBC1486829.1 dihydroxyacetone kinase subunit L [Listeria seeligeri]